MLNGILRLVKEHILEAVVQTDVPIQKQVATIETASTIILSNIKNKLNRNSINTLFQLFETDTSQNNIINNPIISSTIEAVVSGLKDDVGLSPDTAKSVATIAIPRIIKSFAQKSKDTYNLDALVESIPKKV